MDTNKLENIISGYGINADDAAWLRALARLTPDRERVIEAIDRTLWNSGVRLTPSQRADAADAAIDAARGAK